MHRGSNERRGLPDWGLIHEVAEHLRLPVPGLSFSCRMSSKIPATHSSSCEADHSGKRFSESLLIMKCTALK